MFRRSLIIGLIAMLAIVSGCSRKNNVKNPLAQVDSKQPDKVLFDRAMDALQHNKFDTARLTFQTLINTYPDSEYIARAKLGVADSWYQEGGSTGYAQAESEYKDFITFFPNLPEAAEAQMKVGDIHYRQMEKPDRDYTHARRAEEEYREMLKQFPDSKLVPAAQQKLRNVQEVLAEREFRVAHFYFLRESFPAAVARYKSLTDQYPLYSNVDQALFELGQSYEGLADLMKRAQIQSANKEKLMGEYLDKAADAYSRIITRYPEMDRVGDARHRLEALGKPVPTPTSEAIAQNKKELEGRDELGMFSKVMLNFHKRPDVAMAARSGEPSMADQREASASDLVKQAIRAGGGNPDGDTKSSLETIKEAPKGSAEPPRSDAAAPPNTSSTAGPNDTAAPSGESAIPELKPNASNAPQQAPDNAAPLPPPPQVNEAAQPQSTDPKAQTNQQNSSSSDKDKKEKESSSKKKKKKKLGIF